MVSKEQRRKTLINLIDELSELRDDENSAAGPASTVFEEDRDNSISDLSAREAKDALHCFKMRFEQVDSQLQSFINSIQHIGSSVGLLSIAYRLRDSFGRVYYLFRDNASSLFQIPNISVPEGSQSKRPTKKRLWRRTMERRDPAWLPEEMESLASLLLQFREGINQIPEFSDEVVNELVDSSVTNFCDDLNYWASCLTRYQDQFHHPHIQRYVNELMEEMGRSLESLTRALTMFVDIGIPTIRFTQHQTAEGLQNLSTVAIFLSGVGATTLQFSYTDNSSTLQQVVNLFWTSSLIFSLSSAINSQLAYRWRLAFYRSPDSRVPFWVLAWITHTPLMFLVASVVSFSFGLVCFSFSAFSGTFVPVVVTAFSSVTSFALFIVGWWFIGEKYTFSKTQGSRWLADVLLEHIMSTPRQWRDARRAFHMSISSSMQNVRPRASVFARKIRFLLRQIYDKLVHICTHDRVPVLPSVTSRSTAASDVARRTLIPVQPSPTSLNNAMTTGPYPIRSDSLATSTQFSRSSSPGPKTKSQGRFNTNASPGRTLRHLPLVDALRSFSPAQHLSSTKEQTAYGRFLRFCPGGQYLATSSWDQTILIWAVSSPLNVSLYNKLHHRSGVVQDIAWSFDAQLVASVLPTAIRIWNVQSARMIRSVERDNRQHKCVKWLNTRTAWALAEGGSISIHEMNETPGFTHNFENLQIHDIAITANDQRMLLVATMLQSHTGLRPLLSRPESCIIVFNLQTRVIESLIPTFREIRYLNLSPASFYVVVSGPKIPPLLYVLNIRDGNEPARLILTQTYSSPEGFESHGPNLLGTLTDTGGGAQVVMAAGQGGSVCFWDRKTGLRLGVLHTRSSISRTTARSGDTTIAWDNARSIVAVGSHDEPVHIWKTSRSSTPEGEVDTGAAMA